MSDLQSAEAHTALSPAHTDTVPAVAWSLAIPCGSRVLAVLCCVIATVLLFATAPKAGDFWWSESPRNAVNGAFLLDFIRALPFRDPVGWAYHYYGQYPALTIFFYSALFYVFGAVAYALFGVSHAVAQGTESLFVSALALGAYALARQFLKPHSAPGAAIALVGAPEVALWGRQIMLDVPALAFIVWMLYATFRLIETRRAGFIYAIAALVLAAIYVKINAGYIAIVIAIVLFRAPGSALLRNRHFWIAGALFVVGSIPVAVMQVDFGAFNLASLQGQGAETRLHPFNRLESWLYYVQALPGQLGWIPTVAALVAIVVLLALPDRRASLRRLSLPSHWLLVGYVIFGFVSLKEPRHAITFLFPLILFTCFGIERVAGRTGPPLAALFGAGVLVSTLTAFPAPAVAGYRQAADYIAANAPRDGLVMYSGPRDGSFIFNLRGHEDRRDLSVWRADKLLVDVVVMRDHGIRESELDENAIRQRIHDSGVSYIVAQDGFWDDLAVMCRFETVLHGPGFEALGQVPLTGTPNSDGKTLPMYRVTGPVGPRSKNMLNSPLMAKPTAAH